ncbi:uncharacterized protein LOC122512618 [Leptopilina heterotoma]|uniref:uncharacterized protein LOC122512618 n=1 Tax=Leptopilina heterotoma TaxID=63436 RepID=UPI001CA9C0A6|nr:uncharacterized protein LOC122512618 [Leptopilina heterotoma]XP_043484485.1 uncharacterized protein LOC122512618 [Leptopilina heterotoma]
MNVTFVSPLDTIQIISIFSYVNSLSDFLFIEKYLDKEDQYKHIPIVNALYNYLDDTNDINLHHRLDYKNRKVHLAKSLINNTDFYGAKDGEIPDSHFVDKLIEYIVSSLVFEKFTGVYGFIGDILSSVDNDSYQYLMQRFKRSLFGLKFDNEDGKQSVLESRAVYSTFSDIIEPLFPKPKNVTIRVTSVDYIYAQAGKMFLNSGDGANFEEKGLENLEKDGRKVGGLPSTTNGPSNQNVDENYFNDDDGYYQDDNDYYQDDDDDDNSNYQDDDGNYQDDDGNYQDDDGNYQDDDGNAKDNDDDNHKDNDIDINYHDHSDGHHHHHHHNDDDENKFQEYIETAHTIEQLVLAKKINETVLKIFALPAFINYVYNQRQSLQSSKNVAKLFESQELWTKAFQNLFTRLNEAFLEIEKVQNEDHRYQFYLALASIKNRTTLARETIEINCPSQTKIDEEVTNYKNNPESYHCKNGKVLGNLNLNFQHLIANVTEKYEKYEKESCREAFGKSFIETMNRQKVIISKGLIHYPLGFDFSAHQLIRPSDDLFEFYLPENETFLYFALIRNNYNVTLIEERTNPILFRQKLGLDDDETLKDKYFPETMKTSDEDFDKFLSRIAGERSKKFGDNLKKVEYDETKTEWWKHFGLSLIPFYSCVQDIKEKKILEASIFCPLDVLFFIPLVGEIGSLAGKMSTTALKTVVSLTETTMRTITLRTSLKTALRITGKLLILEVKEFSKIFTREAFQKIGKTALRFIDPGFELLFRLGKGSISLIRKTLLKLETIHLASFRTIRNMLDRTLEALRNFPKRIGTVFKKPMYINSLGGNSGYGYKYIPLSNGELAEVRTVYPSRKEVVLLPQKSCDLKQTYRKVDFGKNDLMGEVIGEEYFVDKEGFVVSEEKSYELPKISQSSEALLEGGNILAMAVKNLRPKKQFLAEAINYGVKQGRLNEKQIGYELKKYTFSRNEKTELNFVREWSKDLDLKIPKWAQPLKIEESELFYTLTTKQFMDFPKLSFKEASYRIEKLYPRSNYQELHQELSIDKVFDDFIKKKVYIHATFEDYYALRNYGFNGYRKMAENSHEARRMKNAIYRLAVRQSEDPGEKCVGTLFRGERRRTEILEGDFRPDRESISINRFTSTTTDLQTANIYSETVSPLETKAIYTIRMKEPYLRARVEHLFVLNEKETILLPGMEFGIDKVTRGVREMQFGTQNYMNIELSLAKNSLVRSQQSAMREIKKLMETDTVFYAKDSPK